MALWNPSRVGGFLLLLNLQMSPARGKRFKSGTFGGIAEMHCAALCADVPACPVAGIP